MNNMNNLSTPEKCAPSKKRGRNVDVEDESNTLDNRDNWKELSDDEVDGFSTTKKVAGFSTPPTKKAWNSSSFEFTSSLSTNSNTDRFELIAVNTRSNDPMSRYYASRLFDVPPPVHVFEPVHHAIHDLIHMEGIALDNRRAEEALGQVTNSMSIMKMESQKR